MFRQFLKKKSNLQRVFRLNSSLSYTFRPTVRNRPPAQDCAQPEGEISNYAHRRSLSPKKSFLTSITKIGKMANVGSTRSKYK